MRNFFVISKRTNVPYALLVCCLPLLTPPAFADPQDIVLERHDEMIEWSSQPPFEKGPINGEYKDIQLAPTADGKSLLLFLPVTRSREGHQQALFRWNANSKKFVDITGNLQIDMTIPRDTYDADFADLNGDGYQDIVHSSPHGNFIYMNNGSDVFQDETESRLPTFLRTDCRNVWDDVVVGDIDGDNDLDLMFANRSFTGAHPGCQPSRPYGPNTLLYNDGTGHFGQPQYFGQPDGNVEEDREGSSHGIELADLNNDGRLDLVISHSSNYTNVGGTAPDLEYLLNQGDPENDGLINLAPSQTIASGGKIINLEVFDFDNDGDLDIYAARIRSDTILENNFIQQGNGSFAFTIKQPNAGEPGIIPGSMISYDVSVGDVNNDGFLDVATPDADTRATPTGNSVFLNDSGKHLIRSNDQLMTSAPFFRLSNAFVDIDGDYDLDMIWGSDGRYDQNDPPQEPLTLEHPTVLLNTSNQGDSILPRIEAVTVYPAPQGKPSAVFRARITDRVPDINEIQSHLTWSTTGSMGSTVRFSGPTPLKWVGKLTYQTDLPYCALTAGFRPGETLDKLKGVISATDAAGNTYNSHIEVEGIAIPENLPCGQGFENTTPTPISEGAPNTVQSSIVVHGYPGAIQNLTVTVDIEHTWVGELALSLLGPNNQQVLLAKSAGANGDHFRNTTFDIEADLALSQGVPPFEGVYRPDQDLKPFRGTAPNGTWSLEVRDTGHGDGGTLKSWSLKFSDN